MSKSRTNEEATDATGLAAVYMKDLWKLQAKGTAGMNITTHGPVAWKDAMLKVCKYLFPEVACELEDMEEQEPEAEPEEPEDGASRYEVALFEHQIKEIIELESLRRRQRKKMVAFMALYISKDVHSTAKRTYDKFDMEGDIPACYTAIQNASLRIGTRDAYKEKEDADTARAEFKATGWKRYPTLEQLFEGYTSEVTNLWAELGMDPLPDADRVRDIIAALPPTLNQYKADKKNEYTRAKNKPEGTQAQAAAKELEMSMVYPEDTDALYAEVSAYEIETVDRHGRKGTANFATIMALGLDKAEKEVSKALNLITDLAANKENWKPRAGGKTAPREPKEVDLTKPPPGPCPGCSQRYGPDARNKDKWHWLQKCPVYLKATKEKEAEAEKKPTKGEKRREKREKALATIAVKLGEASINYATIEYKPRDADIPESWKAVKDYLENYATRRTTNPKYLHFLDTACSAATYKDEALLSNIRPGDSSITVNTAGGVYMADQVGDSIFEGTVIYRPECPGNIGCAADLQRRYKITSVKRVVEGRDIIVAYVMHLSHLNYDVVYKLERKVYVADLGPLLDKFPDIFKYPAPEPVSEPGGVSIEEIERALGRKLLSDDMEGVNLATKVSADESINFEPRVVGKISSTLRPPRRQPLHWLWCCLRHFLGQSLKCARAMSFTEKPFLSGESD